ncbi:MAG: glycosyltransferase family 2 protein [Methanosphaera sp.]|nr:glycosyltransferase family 2 protein [Methanosphaera sp.]
MSYKISVIIPTYNIIKENSKNTFDRTINSLKKQSIGFENLEIIIVDDNSNQESKDFLEKLDKEHENIKVIFLLENNGSPSKPRNVGIKNSTTDYIMFLDQDDTFTQKSCEVMYNTINNKHADIVSSNYIIKMNNNKYVAFHENPLYKEFNPNHSLNKFQKQYAPWARIFRKSLLDKLKLPDKILLEDSYMNFNAFIKSQKVIYLNDFFSYQYTVNEESITLNSKKSTIIKGLDGIREIILVLNKYPDNIPLVIDDLFSMV